MRAIQCSGEQARQSTQHYTYSACMNIFRAHLVPLIQRLPASSSVSDLSADVEASAI
jgi:hypothetical protein